MKKVLVLIVALALILSTVPAFAQIEEGAKLVYWDMIWSSDPNYEPTVRKLCEKFTEETGVEVELQMIPWDNHYQTFMTAINAGVGPDVATGGAYNGVYYGAMGMTLDLSSIVEEWKAENNPILNDFLDGALTDHNYNGQLTGLSWNCDLRVMYYNVEAMNKAGISPEEAQAPKTWDEFLDMLRKVKEANPDKIAFAFPAGDYTATHTLMNWSGSNNCGIVDKDVKAGIDNKNWLEVAEFFKTLVDEGLVSKSAASYVSDDIERLYCAGEIAVVWSSCPTGFVAYPEVQANTELMGPVQGPSGDGPHMLSWYNPIYAYNYTKYPEAAKAFCKWYVENNITLFTEGGMGAFPARYSFMEKAADFYESDWLTSRIKNLNYLNYSRSSIYPAPSIYPAVSDIEGNNTIGEMLQAILMGESNLEELIKTTNENVAAILANY